MNFPKLWWIWKMFLMYWPVLLYTPGDAGISWNL